MPIRSKSPAFTTSGESLASKKKSFFLVSPFRSHPNVAALATICWVLSSKATKRPASLVCVAPLTSDCSAKTVFPQPGPPITSVVPARGYPPLVIWSNPSMPVAALAMGEYEGWFSMSWSFPRREP
jgi:hypothetical protein